MTTASTGNPSQAAEFIAGYELVGRIGAGGYGEVWKVRAPGGMLKAIKLVYGHFDDDRATREMKAVTSMKEVRHPFILSIERIETAGGRLAIVTELADGSLKDRFDACRAEGLPGIPRDELLGYLRDAADALDFLCQSHSLQHLDIKPENLLLVAGRVKVADFGMVKSVRDPAVSQLNALTPVYAPPEIFDGQPSGQSDQYSLAIVYQEMLTGTLPYSGRTTAQLAAQHLYGRPILTRLPVADQPVIQRALSKDAKQRFSNCRALVDALTSGTAPSATTISNVAPQDTVKVVHAAPRPTVLLPARFAGSVSDRGASPMQESAEPSRSLTACAASRVEPDDTNDWARPTLFIGIGGLGGKVLGVLRRRLRDRFGDRTAVHALQMLYIDTCAKAAFDATRGDELESLDPSQTVSIPLQAAQDYRSDAKHLLGWLNRRWLYNIPRSLQTEGIRALGRLAYVDHAATAWDRIRASLAAACDTNGVITSAAVTGLPFVAAAPRVFVVAASTGGAGGGIALDIAFGLKRLLRDLNYDDERLCLLLAHLTDRRGAGRDLAVANSYACLAELEYFGRHPFVGTGEGPNAVNSADDQGLSHTYVAHLGDDLGEVEFAAGAESLADFLYFNSVTRAASFFDAFRSVDNDRYRTREPAARSFAIRTLGALPGPVVAQAVDDLCRTFVDVWRGVPAAERSFTPTNTATTLLRESLPGASSGEAMIGTLAQQQAEACNLNYAGAMDMVDGIVRRCMGAEPIAWMQTLAAHSHELPEHASAIQWLESRFNQLALSVEPYLEKLAESLAETVVGGLRTLAADHETRTRGARIAAEWWIEHLRNVRQRTQSPLTTLEARLSTLAAQLQPIEAAQLQRLLNQDSQGPQAEDSTATLLAMFVRQMTECIVTRGLAKLLAAVQAPIRALSEQLTDMGRDLAHLSEHFAASGAERAPAGAAWHELHPALAKTLTSRLRSALEEMERAVEGKLFGTPQSLRKAIELGQDIRGKLPAALRAAARAIVHRAIKSPAAASADQSDGNVQRLLQSASAGLAARWLNLGGVRRTLVMLPESSSRIETPAQFDQAFGGACSIVSAPDENLAVCFEVSQIPVREILADLAEGRGNIPQIAEKLRTRTDIDWSRG